MVVLLVVESSPGKPEVTVVVVDRTSPIAWQKVMKAVATE
jgi:hypothetical protein